MQLIVRTLNPRKEMFVREYLANGFKHIDAAMAACPTQSRVTASRLAKAWLSDSNVQRAIRELMDLRAQRLDISADAVMQDLATIADSNAQDLYDEHGKLLPVHKLPRRVASCIKEVEERETIDRDGVVTVNRKYKLYDRLTALDKLARALSLFCDKSDPENESEKLNVNLQINFVEAEDGRRVDHHRFDD